MGRGKKKKKKKLTAKALRIQTLPEGGKDFSTPIPTRGRHGPRLQNGDTPITLTLPHGLPREACLTPTPSRGRHKSQESPVRGIPTTLTATPAFPLISQRRHPSSPNEGITDPNLNPRAAWSYLMTAEEVAYPALTPTLPPSLSPGRRTSSLDRDIRSADPDPCTREA